MTDRTYTIQCSGLLGWIVAGLAVYGLINLIILVSSLAG